MKKRFVPKEFTPPVLETECFRLRALTVHDVIKDYDAVMTSIEHLQKTQPLGPHRNWPPTELTLEQDLIDLGWHQKEFQRKDSFAYTVVAPDESICLGCVYIDPSSNTAFDAQVTLWVRQSAIRIDGELFVAVKKWIAKSWPFQKVAYPGRDIPWDDFLD